MAVEEPRSCGYRKVGGLYICSDPAGQMSCDRIPYELEVCPVCGSGIKFSRSITWIDWNQYAKDHGRLEKCIDSDNCPVCFPSMQHQPYGIIWVGERFYSVEDFIQEAVYMGISRRIPFGGKTPSGPNKLKLGETWLLFAFKNYFEKGKDEKGNEIYNGGVFYAAKPTRLEYLIWEKDATHDLVESLEKRNITPIIIPDGDSDHDPETPLVTDESIQVRARHNAYFNSLRSKLKGSK